MKNSLLFWLVCLGVAFNGCSTASEESPTTTQNTTTSSDSASSPASAELGDRNKMNIKELFGIIPEKFLHLEGFGEEKFTPELRSILFGSSVGLGNMQLNVEMADEKAAFLSYVAISPTQKYKTEITYWNTTSGERMLGIVHNTLIPTTYTLATYLIPFEGDAWVDRSTRILPRISLWDLLIPGIDTALAIQTIQNSIPGIQPGMERKLYKVRLPQREKNILVTPAPSDAIAQWLNPKYPDLMLEWKDGIFGIKKGDILDTYLDFPRNFCAFSLGPEEKETSWIPGDKDTPINRLRLISSNSSLNNFLTLGSHPEVVEHKGGGIMARFVDKDGAHETIFCACNSGMGNPIVYHAARKFSAQWEEVTYTVLPKINLTKLNQLWEPISREIDVPEVDFSLVEFEADPTNNTLRLRVRPEYAGGGEPVYVMKMRFEEGKFIEE